jgi:DNA processing protein
VHAGGVDVVYPAENANLAARIAARGARIAELPPGAEPQARHFPQRNRIVSGIALGVVVVEAAEGSGSLITARAAADQGREIMAVPGHPVDARAAGCNALIRDGATLVRHPADVIEALGPALAAARAARAAMALPAESAAGPPAPAARLRRLTEAALAAIRGRMTATEAAAPSPACPARGRAPAATPARAPAGPSGARQAAGEGMGEPCPRPAGLPGAAPGDVPPPEPAPRDRAAAEAKPSRTNADDRRPGGDGRAFPAPGTDAAAARAGAMPQAPLHRRILDRLGPSPLAEDQLIRDLGLTPAEVAPDLLSLELEGMIERQPGGLVVRIV